MARGGTRLPLGMMTLNEVQINIGVFDVAFMVYTPIRCYFDPKEPRVFV